jgi:hypothetical protein
LALCLQAIGFCFWGIAALGFFFIVRGVVREYRLQDLPEAEGLMESCEPILSQTNPGTNTNVKSAPLWVVQARYSYNLNGVRYTGTELSNIPPTKVVHGTLDWSNEPPESIAAICRRYSAGTKIEVHYQLDNPKESFVYFTSPLHKWPWIIAPLLAVFLGGVFLFMARLGSAR